MKLPKSIHDLICEECNQNLGKDEFISLSRRKDNLSTHQPYKILPENKWAELLQSWYDFHSYFPYDSFFTFYSKSKFCTWLQPQHFEPDQEKSKEIFLKLLADRKFYYLEYNEHLNAPEYPSLSEIVQKPDLYDHETNEEIIAHARKVKSMGFIPTYAHRGAYKEMVANYSELTDAIQELKRCLEKDRELRGPLEHLYQTITFKVEPFDGPYSPLEESLSTLFRAFIMASANSAYITKYKDLLKCPENNYLCVIHGLLSCLEKFNLTAYQSLAFFQLFTQNTTKLAQGRLKEYKFAPIHRRAAHKLPSDTQDVARRKIENNIMLFDHLTQIFSLDDPGFIKYLFFKHTLYYGYYHYHVSSDQEKWFSCLPNPNDSVDHLSGTFRRNIQHCMPNEISWLIPNLPNDRTINAEALAVSLLRDATFLPVYTRLTDRVRRLLNDSEVGDKMVREYQAAYKDQSETRRLLEQWCAEYRLEFIGESIAADLSHQEKALKKTCNRFVLEFSLKEKIYAKARSNLSEIARTLFGDLCIQDESFSLT